MKINIYDDLIGYEQCSVAEMSELAPVHLSLDERVPGVPGRAFELKSWHRAWKQRHETDESREPVIMKVEAVDEFQAAIPWEQLNKAVFLYELDGKPLQKGFPIRLYVPDGSSECLNVKSVVTIRFLYAGAAGEATYGFKNSVPIEDLRRKK
ncbi:hypothetical protein DVH26_07550 [Paenibacillus sp. H1-7]|uniref:hypothetical protein n=1 Tax=Paenibacillus sp. H1-7 TaxID=2282849 RepID=UPI001EF8C695|nr:hypothetical protein [Paenibacillus sp. H1-7]ULL14313.1 hypothetical protein DVH26_07550 [Paenibacillus sp. H1-7]